MKTRFLKSIPLFYLVLFGLGGVVNGQVNGDEKALVLVNRMLTAIGGKEVWKNARAININLRGYYAREELPWNESYWMDLDQPKGRFVIKNATKNQIIAWTPAGGWDMNESKVVALDSAHHAFEMAYWKIQPVVVFHRLAKGYPKTRVEMGDNEFRFDVFDTQSDQLLAQFALNLKGEPIKWGSKIDEQEFEHIFGPLKKYNNINFPSWGSVLSGVWRYEHLEALLSQSPAPVNFDPPKPK